MKTQGMFKNSRYFMPTRICLLSVAAASLATPASSALEYGHVDINDPQTQIPDSVRPLFDTPVRDTQICAAQDGFYYLTGTTMHEGGSFGDWNMGVHVWKSRDLKQWEPLGLVWNLDKTKGWQRFFYLYPENKDGGSRLAEPGELTFEMRDKLKARRGSWANEIHWAPKLNTFVIAGSMNYNVGTATEGKEPIGIKTKGGTYLLKSVSGKAEGPYADIQPDRPLTPRIDASFFVDDDGSMYFVYQDGRIAKLKDDLSGLAEEPWSPQETTYPREAYAEGAFLFKADGKYHLAKTYWSTSKGDYTGKPDKYSYDPVTASAESLKGPYGKRHTPITGGGHGNFFKDHEGNWWACVFNNPRNKCNKGGWKERPAIVAMKWVDGRLKVDKERTDAFYADLVAFSL